MSAWVMRSGWIAAATLAIFVVASTTGIVSGGPLDPPAPPAPTMKTLGEVEPRTPLSQPGAFPITISQPGSYYLTGNITGVAGQNGIVIFADNVSIDLMGFTLGGVPGSLDGIRVPQAQPRRGIVLRDGTVSNWGADGIYMPTSSDIIIDAVTARENVVAGFDVGDNARVSNCVVTSLSGFDGGQHVLAIRAGNVSVVTACSTRGYTTGIAVGNYSQVLDSDVTAAKATGIYGGVAVIDRCTVTQIGGATGVGHYGILTQSSVQGSQVSHNLVSHVFEDGNDIAGIRVDGYAAVTDNVVIDVQSFTPVQAAAIDVQGGGINVHDNDITDAKTGIRVLFGQNTVYDNHLRLVSTPIFAVAGNDIAPISTAALATSPVANIVD